MSPWLLLSISAPLFWGISNIFDAALRRHFIEDDFVLSWLTSFGRLVFLVFWILFQIQGLPSGNWGDILLMTGAGFLFILPFFFYFRVLHFEETSRIILILQLQSIFILILAFFMVDERLSLHQFLAFIFIFVGGVIAALNKSKAKWHFSKAFWLMVLASFLWSLGDVSFKKMEPFFADFDTAMAFFLLGAGIPSLFALLFGYTRTKIRRHLLPLTRQGWMLLLLSQFLGTMGVLAFGKALTLGKASLTAVFAEIQPLFVFLLGVFLVPLFSKHYREDTGRFALLTKGVSFGMIVLGVVYLHMTGEL